MGWFEEMQMVLELKTKLHTQLSIDNIVTEPPCKNGCIWWAARVITRNNQADRSIRFCWADKMYPDFSCYETILEANKILPNLEEIKEEYDTIFNEASKKRG